MCEQETLGLLEYDATTEKKKCKEGSDLYESLVCPFGFELKDREEVEAGCAEAGLVCPSENHQCVCSPCKHACEANARLNSDGSCVCKNGYVDFAGSCQELSTAILSTVLPTVAILALLIYALIRFIHHRSDTMWHIHPMDLKFEDPPECLGSGSFGIVLKAEYRGTVVAVKRVLPPAARRKVRASVVTDENHSYLEQLSKRQAETRSPGELMDQYFLEAAQAAGQVVSQGSGKGSGYGSGRGGQASSSVAGRSTRGSSYLRRRKQLAQLKCVCVCVCVCVCLCLCVCVCV